MLSDRIKQPQAAKTAAKFTFQPFRHPSKTLPVGGSAHFWHKSLTYPMLRGSGCSFGLWFHSTLHFLSTFFLCFQTDQLLPRYPERKLHFRKKEKRKTNHFRLQIPLVSPPTVLLFSSQVSCTPASLSASLCPRVSTASDTADLPFPCVITRREPFGSAVRARQTEECRWTSDSRVLLAQTSSRTCAAFPSRLWARSHWDPIQLSRWDRGASWAPSDGHDANHQPILPFLLLLLLLLLMPFLTEMSEYEM